MQLFIDNAAVDLHSYIVFGKARDRIWTYRLDIRDWNISVSSISLSRQMLEHHTHTHTQFLTLHALSISPFTVITVVDAM